MPIISIAGKKIFEGFDNSSILDSAIKTELLLPYSCKTGRCGTCKCKIVSGTTTVLYPEGGLSNEERAEGWILSCARAPKTDLVLEAIDTINISLPASKTWPCRISHTNFLAPDVLQVFLRLPPNSNFIFLPGQYIDVIGPTGIRRSYSLANSNFSDKLLELHIRFVENGVMSRYWFKEAKVNDLLRINGPLGTFFIRETRGLNLIFLATGTGFAPVKAMLESLDNVSLDDRPKSVKFLWGGREYHDLYFGVEKISSNFSYTPVLSRADKTWQGARGHVQNVLLDMVCDLAMTSVYACGSYNMIQTARVCLTKAGLPNSSFYSDAFVSSSV